MAKRPRRLRSRLPDLNVAQILAWAEAHHRRTGRWPNVSSGPVYDNPNEKWRGLDMDLRRGYRGLRPGPSLAQLLADERGVRNPKDLPALSITQILTWADARYVRTGKWPTRHCGPVSGAPGETWEAVHGALLHGRRGLRGRRSLAELLAHERGVRNHMHLPALTVKQILRWADAHFARTGRWPREDSGPVIDAPGETWCRVDQALEKGFRGLPGRSSLPRLLAEHRGVPNQRGLAPFDVKTILAWADAFHARTGHWPKAKSGAIAEAPGETWHRAHTALIEGLRGLPGGSSLPRLLAQYRGARNHMGLPRLTVEQVVTWAMAHQERTGRWPTALSGAVDGVPDLTWKAISMALLQGLRGLPPGLSLPRLRARKSDY